MATLSNNVGFMLNTKYKWQAWTFYGSYEYIRQQNQATPHERVPNDRVFQCAGNHSGFNLPGTFANKKLPTQWAVNNNYNIPRQANVFWVGAKYSVPDDWMHGWGSADLIGAYYWLGQNDYNYSVSTAKATAGITMPAACTTVVTSGVKPKRTRFDLRLNSGKWRLYGFHFRPDQLASCQTRGRLRGYHDFERLCGSGKRLLRDSKINPTAGIRIKF